LAENAIVEIYTDGACSGNPGPGGWAALMLFGAHEKVISGGFRRTTNNRMELMAVIEGLKSLNRPCTVTIHSDSKLITDAYNQKWINSWLKHNWKKGPRKKDPVKNKDLWIEMVSLTDFHNVKFNWIKGHAGIEGNEIADQAAVKAAATPNLPADEVYEQENS
jgi:ribonuclease HI